MLNKEAFELYKLLKNNEISHAKVLDALNLFNEFLENLSKNVCKKSLKEDFINHWVFKSDIDIVTIQDQKNFFKANIFAASRCLNRIINKIRSEELNIVTKRLIKNFICDLKPFITFFDKNQDYTWLISGTNNHITNFYNSLSNHIFWSGMPGNHPEEKLVLSTVTPFLIRQSIEYKIKRILGIDFYLINGKPDLRTVDKCFSAIERNIPFYKFKNIDFKIIKQIYSWTNYYIHGGYRSEPWRTETALENLKGLFYSGQTSNKDSFSTYAGIELLESDLPNVLKNTADTLKNGVLGKIEIKWLLRPELVLIKK